jgi:hypothetical protein
MLSSCSDSDLPKAAKAFREKIQQDNGVYTVEFGHRFVSDVIIVGCVTAVDKERVQSDIGVSYFGHEIHYVAPIWGVAGLDSANKETLEKMLQDPRYMTAHTAEWEQSQVFIKQANVKDMEIWSSWSPEEKGAWLKKFIIDRRRTDPMYANCGDKFLLPD